MKINISNLKDKINKINNIIRKYEEVYLNYYNDLSQASMLWKGTIANDFLNDSISDKEKIKPIISNLNEIKELYQYIVEKYKSYGNTINYNLSNKDEIIINFNNCKAKLNEIINLYSEVISIYNNYIITSELEQIKKNKKEIEIIEDKIITMIKEIEEHEKDISLKIDKINLEYIKEEFDIKKHL